MTADLALAAKALESLTAEQQRVVTAHDGPLLVLAGAGSGKTTTLTRRVAHMIASGIEPASILVLSFTRAAAEMMIERAHQLHPEAVHVEGGTFHSFAARTVSRHLDALGLKTMPTILDGDDATEIVRLVAADIPRDDGNYPRASAIQAMLSFATNTRLPLAEVLTRQHAQWRERLSYVEEIATRFAAYKREHGVADFDDLLVLATECLKHPVAGPLTRAQHRYVLVDEHQDSNALQLDLIKALAGDQANIMVVGDPAQAIYGFRGAAPGAIIDFPQHFPGAQVLKLQANFRSSAPILAAANAIDRAMSPRFERELRAAAHAGTGKPRLVTVNNLLDEARRLTGTILQEVQNGGSYARHAVLVRSLSMARMVETEFLAWKVPYLVKGGIRLTESAQVKDLLALARIVHSVSYTPAWLRLLQYAPKVGAKSAAKIADRVTDAPNATLAARKLRDAVEGTAPLLLSLADAITELTAADDLKSRLHRATEMLEPLLAHRYGEEWQNRKRDLELVVQLAARFDTVGAFLNDLALDLNVGRATSNNTAHIPEDAVTISTIHSAKGLEWEHVHVPGFIAGNYPSRFAQRDDERAEELRCLYVAVTRAKSQLTFYRPLTLPNAGIQDDSPYWSIIRFFVDAPTSLRTQAATSQTNASH